MGCKSAKILTRRIYFDERNTLQTSINPLLKPEDFKKNIKLGFSLENIENNHYYQLTINFKGEAPFSTENALCQSGIINFNKCYIGCYYFEKKQILDILLLKDGVQNGSLSITLGNIVGSINSTYKGSFNNQVRINISAEGLSEDISYLICQLNAKCNSSQGAFYQPEDKISYIIKSQNRKIYESESISSQGTFQEIKIPLNLLDRGFTISFLDCYQEPISYKNEIPQQFCLPNNNEYLGIINRNKSISIFNKSYIMRNLNFIDYIKSGVRIKLSIGIDYTESNLSPTDPKSLHYLGENMNDYEQAIQACGMICAYYDYNQQFPVYGYGAFINGQRPANMCFNINFKNNPEIFTINNVLKEYRNSFKYLQLAGPTNFSPLVQHVVNKIKAENNPMHYHILLILTDGIINDLQETIDALVEGSFFPLSVIIIGIGNDSFEEMVILDGDNVPIVDSRGLQRKRDLVQFVPFNKFKNNPTNLAEQVLEEVPRQVIEYYAQNNIFPNNIKANQTNETFTSRSRVLVNDPQQSKQQKINNIVISPSQIESKYINLNIHQ